MKYMAVLTSLPDSFRRLAAFIGIIAAVFVLTACAAQKHHAAGLRALTSGEFAEGLSELQKASELAPEEVKYRQDWLIHRDATTGKLIAKAEASIAGDLRSVFNVAA